MPARSARAWKRWKSNYRRSIFCAYIKRFDTNCITLTTGEVLPIGRSKHTEFMEKYLEYIHKNGISIIG